MKRPRGSHGAQAANGHFDHALLATPNLRRNTPVVWSLILNVLVLVSVTSLYGPLSRQAVSVARTGPSQLMAGKPFKRSSDIYQTYTRNNTPTLIYDHLNILTADYQQEKSLWKHTCSKHLTDPSSCRGETTPIKVPCCDNIAGRRLNRGPTQEDELYQEQRTLIERPSPYHQYAREHNTETALAMTADQGQSSPSQLLCLVDKQHRARLYIKQQGSLYHTKLVHPKDAPLLLSDKYNLCQYKDSFTLPYNRQQAQTVMRNEVHTLDNLLHHQGDAATKVTLMQHSKCTALLHMNIPHQTGITMAVIRRCTCTLSASLCILNIPADLVKFDQCIHDHSQICYKLILSIMFNTLLGVLHSVSKPHAWKRNTHTNMEQSRAQENAAQTIQCPSSTKSHVTHCKSTQLARYEDTTEHVEIEAKAEMPTSAYLDKSMIGGAPIGHQMLVNVTDLGEDNDLHLHFGGKQDSTDWLSYRQIHQCLELLLHTKYTAARHQPRFGSAHEVCSAETLTGHLNNAAKGLPFVRGTDIPKVIYETLQTNGPSPAIVIGNHVHWTVLCIHAPAKSVIYIDPTGAGFSNDVQQDVKTFYRQHDNTADWQHTQWNRTLQTHSHNCGIWAIWIVEKWMHHWCQANRPCTFESFCMQHTTSPPDGQALRMEYHAIVQQGQIPDINGQSDQDKAHKRAVKRRNMKYTPIKVDKLASPGQGTAHASPEADKRLAETRQQNQLRSDEQYADNTINSDIHVMYLKKQYRQFCQVHSLNAMFGRQIVTPTEMVNFCQLETQHDTSLAGMLKAGWYHAENGNFTNQVMNAWLHHHSQPTVRLNSIKSYIPVNSTKQDFITALPPGHDTFRIRWNVGDEAYESSQCGHAVCVRRQPGTHNWYLLDSERPNPVKLTPTEWSKLRGEMEILDKGSAYNYGMIYRAEADGYSQYAVSPNYMHPESVTISKSSNASERLLKQNVPEDEIWIEVKRRSNKRMHPPLATHKTQAQEDQPHQTEPATALHKMTNNEGAAHLSTSDHNVDTHTHCQQRTEKSNTAPKQAKNESVKNRKQLSKPKQGKAKTEEQDRHASIRYHKDAKKIMTPGHQAAATESLKGICWNVRGLTTVLEELTKLAHDHDPDFIVLTETKLRDKGLGKQCLMAALPEYRLHTSCKKNNETAWQGERSGSAGVAIALHSRLTRHASVSFAMLNNQAAAGHCQLITLQPAGSDAIDIWGVYMPHDTKEREQVYQLLRDNISPDRYSIMAGDMNAAYCAADRSSGTLTAADKAHQQLLQELQLQPTDDGTQAYSRGHTFQSESQEDTHSRIDDFTLSKNLLAACKTTTTVLPATDS